ncbi:MAG: DNA methyltransferase [Steroidobacteraceae bacterium]
MKQLSLLDRRPLLGDDVVGRFLATHADEPIPGVENHKKWFENWIRHAASGKEVSLEQAFNAGFFCNFLGYTLYPGDSQGWTAWPKPATKATGLTREPDLILGSFSSEPDNKFEALAVVELKRPGTVLDAPQPSYGNETPVEQAFSVATALPECRWVIVSDMKHLRLYSASDRNTWDEFDIEDVVIGPQKEAALRKLWLLLRRESLTVGAEDSTLSRLLAVSERDQLIAQQGFYEIYSKVRIDLLQKITEWATNARPDATKRDCILAAQRLLDRVIFIHFCEDHPDRLLPKNVLRGIVENAVKSPGTSPVKAYSAIKQFFRDLDVGVNTQFWKVPRYNGELFKPDPIVDEIELPDELVSRRYTSKFDDRAFNVQGVWGLDVFDFWKELDRNLLGNIFERSVVDIADLSGDRDLFEHAIEEKKSFGVYYTARKLAKFMAGSAVRAMIAEDTAIQEQLTAVAEARDRLEFEGKLSTLASSLQKFRVLDPACGSGAFLTAALDELLTVYRKAVESALRFGHDLTYQLSVASQSEVLRSTIYGVDLLPQAVELAKLALWLTAARLNQPAADLSVNILCMDALDLANKDINSRATYDLVLGNPPWGSVIESSARARLEHVLEEDLGGLDSWEIFVRLATKLLKDGGRLCFVLPDTIFSTEKAESRRFLLEHFAIEKWYSLGPDWFGPDVRMGTVVFQGRRCKPLTDNIYRALVLAGTLRTRSISGNVPLEQVEYALGHLNSQRRAIESDGTIVSLGSSEYDLSLMQFLHDSGVTIETVTDRARGDEMSADGLLWRCPNCHGYTVPGAKKKGGGYKSKPCPFCNLELTSESCQTVLAVDDRPADETWQPVVDGRMLNHRYENPSPRWINVGLEPISPGFKPRETYRPPKVLVRQAGVGVTATLSEDWARCPQSIYIYRINEYGRELGYSEGFLLAVLASRVFNWLVLKSFGEIDPARAHAKLTHSRLASLCIPKLSSDADRQLADRLAALARQLTSAKSVNERIDWEIEIGVRHLWRVSPEVGAYINGFFSTIPDSQVIRDLFPQGAPKPVAEPVANPSEVSSADSRLPETGKLEIAPTRV